MKALFPENGQAHSSSLFLLMFHGLTIATGKNRYFITWVWISLATVVAYCSMTLVTFDVFLGEKNVIASPVIRVILLEINNVQVEAIQENQGMQSS